MSSQLLHHPSQPAASSSKSPEPAPAPANDEDKMLDEEEAAKKIEAEEKTLGAEAYKTRDCDNTIVQQMMSFKQFLEREAAEVDDMQREEAVEYLKGIRRGDGE